MEDTEIISLLQSRNETAVAELSNKYGKYCRIIADNILRNTADAEECVNDTFFKVWRSIPPQNPKCLSAFIARIAKNTALYRYDMQNSAKRGSGSPYISFEELSDIISGKESVEEGTENKEILAAVNDFLLKQPKKKRLLFMGRYWHYYSISELAEIFSMTEHNVAVTLSRTRTKLKEHLLKGGYEL